ncbi:MAG: gamma-glutamyl-gamma-aminobutyrate hydrolase family protein [Thermoanaerobaculia bacterium]
MSKPIIAIGADLKSGPRRDCAFTYLTYVDALRRAGALPLVLPPQPENAAELVKSVDGILLAGGRDIDPELFGEIRHPSVTPMDPRRQTGELALAKHARESGVPTLGICLGMQTMAVAAGGRLIQDIPSSFDDALKHETDESGTRVRHPIRVEPGTKLASILGDRTLDVNSSHHQAVRTPGAGMRIAAHAGDGIIEGIEDPEHRFYVGVQWHPEEMVNEDSAETLFRAFAEAASAYGGGRRK